MWCDAVKCEMQRNVIVNVMSCHVSCHVSCVIECHMSLNVMSLELRPPAIGPFTSSSWPRRPLELRTPTTTRQFSRWGVGGPRRPRFGIEVATDGRTRASGRRAAANERSAWFVMSRHAPCHAMRCHVMTTRLVEGRERERRAHDLHTPSRAPAPSVPRQYNTSCVIHHDA